MTNVTTTYALRVSFWQHNTGDGRCGSRRRDIEFRSLEAAGAMHWRIQTLLEGKFSDERRREIEDDLGLDDVSIEGSEIIRIERSPLDPSMIPARVPDQEEDVAMDD